MNLSPSKINCYYQCPLLFYYKYILKIQEKPSIHLYRGGLVHKLIEDVFVEKKYNHNLIDDVVQQLKDQWNPDEGIDLTPEETKKYLKDSENMLRSFFTSFVKKLTYEFEYNDRVNDMNHAWNLMRPKMSEERITLEDEQIVGIIDSVEQDFDNRIFIVDYKTSKLYKNIVSEDYVRQLRIYAYLFWKKYKQIPDFVGINFLRYGQIYYFHVDQQMLDKAEEDIKFVHSRTQSTDINDYISTNHRWVDYEYFEEQAK